MTTGYNINDERKKHPLDIQGKGQSAGIPASGELEGSSYNPLGNPAAG